MFDKNLAKEFLNKIKNMSFEELEERSAKTPPCGMNAVLEELPLRENLNHRILSSGGRHDQLNYEDKKCIYHRKDTILNNTIFCRLTNKFLGKSYHEFKSYILSKKYKHLRQYCMLKNLNEIRDGVCEYYQFTDNKLEHIKKEFTTLDSFNPFTHKPLDLSEYKKQQYQDPVLIDQYFNFIKALETYKFEIGINGLECWFKGQGIKGYLCADNDDLPIYSELVFVDTFEGWDKVRNARLSFEIPSSSLGIIEALNDVKYLGTKEAKKKLKKDAYHPLHVTHVYYHNR